MSDDYSGASCALGFYPLTALLFEWGIAAWQRETIAAFRHAGAGRRDDPAQRLGPPGGEIPAARLRDIFARAERDALGIPHFATADLDAPFSAYAPVFEIAGMAVHDRIGAVRWGEDGTPVADTAHPVVYRRLASPSTRPATPCSAIRSTPAAAITCSFRRHASPRLRRRRARSNGCSPQPARRRCCPVNESRWRSPPAPMPWLAWRSPQSGAQCAYAWLDEEELRSLPVARGGRRSLVGPDGLVRGTERAERLFFWPMGIASAGAMRQWGRHATAFVGRRHFDDPDLIDLRFERVEPIIAPQAQ